MPRGRVDEQVVPDLVAGGETAVEPAAAATAATAVTPPTRSRASSAWTARNAPADGDGNASSRLRSQRELFALPDFEQTYARMRDPQTGLQLADRRWRLLQYSHCFVGSEAVTWMHDKLGMTRDEAVRFGQQLMDAGVIHHVTYSEPFADAHFFYVFQEDEDTNVLNLKMIWDSSRRPRDPLQVATDLITRLALLCEEHREPPSYSEVDYEALKQSEEFRRYVFAASELQRVDLSGLSHEDKLCFFCNVYNALCLHAHIVHGAPTTMLRRWSFFKSLSYRIAGVDFSLDDIEHGVLRGNQTRPYGLIRQFRPGNPRMQYVLSRRDPRVHFVISAGTQSDPPMRILDGENIEEELHFAAEAFLDHTCKVHPESNEVVLPRIFSWYRDDFVRGDLELLRWILPYLGVDKRRALQQMLDKATDEGSVSIRYESFTWNAEARFHATVVRQKRRRLERERSATPHSPPADPEGSAAANSAA
ncbi:hypothetical protein CDCA_CDCA19G4668 [Cyanidium caldarium]|uniref:DEP domain-containing protein n=1 Tax=Cyanidium caldarium TaxID=2771 RepID=A0AAV9J2R6_CYACA|nr:hypothetical protein CDCA_CDCA19G4668 [Cyanidium caldarium]